MSTTTTSTKSNALPLAFLGLAALLTVAALLTGTHLQIGVSQRAAFLVLAAIGFAMCGLSPLGKGQFYGWANPRHLAGYLIGAALLYLCLTVLFNWPLPGRISLETAFYLLAGGMALKVAIAALYPRRR